MKFFRQKITKFWTLVSQAAACEGFVYTVNLNSQDLDGQGYPLLLFEIQN